MKYQEIKDLKHKIDDRIKEQNSELDDTKLAAMARTEGWEVFTRMSEDMIAELLEAPEFSDETPLDVRGAIHEARTFGIEVLRTLLKTVSSTKAAIKIEQQEKNQSKDS